MAQIFPDVDADSTDPTCLWCCVVGVRASAPLRRGAAPYGDGSQCSQTLTPHFPAPLSEADRFEVHVTMVPCPQRSPLTDQQRSRKTLFKWILLPHAYPLGIPRRRPRTQAAVRLCRRDHASRRRLTFENGKARARPSGAWR